MLRVTKKNQTGRRAKEGINRDGQDEQDKKKR
jgi:hypothetical protein